ncbi:MAG: 16S rRNA (adenine(1518)-N(6)/adenine(1519)-N(6))-dimethyltransferase RsmA [Clostridiales bacterium]|jgi:16S rRNA (adenine1518-N6/adenine1519-N6)-dimethyltransferase|nr:16S rRNA (adenine(1518)-N(6)/adenine(1519)-N(6))-dimethyltransferase RsmA [Clostridiales bacterium]HOB63951.1 16S rRNA (adenine(1518)-N(6)/adenine(1519)-N(6))-dimethyltransferase RsmA [Clostridia bacterium]HOK81728.1 16S rRNA (adenine(1518)-N(6)/adenine(1519)-N(6))-dimethyltransferase RsmA [Clostridia bacterium]HOL60625.1 16S rRNA (adenine(1518)-N(6)/adenine(1519)-N(6))-dimethyltransferase RsmA [Clostridia bacterium]HPO53032.1 16S rRNA (adenine(1518)-N(6)/adenine(1519)-N(6))-dimethyltransfer
MEIQQILRKYDFRFKKSLGQNFIADKGLLSAIVRDAGIENTDLVLEIGAGAGTLTRELSEKAAEVYAFEVDESLAPILAENLSELDNVKVYFRDILKMTDPQVEEITGGRAFKVAANLPYYITTPLIMRFLESRLPVTSLTVMVQKEVADRLIAKPSTPEYGAITLAVRQRGDAKIVRKVSKNMFYPAPKVDSAVVRIDINHPRDLSPEGKTLSRLIKAGFAMRRKTLVNNISMAFGLSKEAAIAIIKSAGLPETIRGEALDLDNYKALAAAISALKES